MTVEVEKLAFSLRGSNKTYLVRSHVQQLVGETAMVLTSKAAEVNCRLARNSRGHKRVSGWQSDS